MTIDAAFMRFPVLTTQRPRAFFRDHYEDEQYFGLRRDEWRGSNGFAFQVEK